MSYLPRPHRKIAVPSFFWPYLSNVAATTPRGLPRVGDASVTGRLTSVRAEILQTFFLYHFCIGIGAFDGIKYHFRFRPLEDLSIGLFL